MPFKLSNKEVLFAIALAVLGFAFTFKEVIFFLNDLNPVEGLLISWFIYFSILAVFAHYDLVIFKYHIKDIKQILGASLITLAFFIITNWESCYIERTVGGVCENISPIFFQSEDGAIWYLWSAYTGDLLILRVLTYIITPFILALVGGYLVTKTQIRC
jgi:hypothetical protein